MFRVGFNATFLKNEILLNPNCFNAPYLKDVLKCTLYNIKNMLIPFSSFFKQILKNSKNK